MIAQAININFVEQICLHFNLGLLIRNPQRVYGGLLHMMWRIDTEKGSFAVKQLSQDIQLQDRRIIKNYNTTENIAACFMQHGIPALSALKKSEEYLFIIDNTGFLVYPWLDANTLEQHVISEIHALKIAVILAKIHHINLKNFRIIQPKNSLITNQKIVELIDKAEYYRCPFARDLRNNQSTLLAVNKAYQKATPILKTHTLISHGDLDQKNVLWDNRNDPILIDWESACKINPTSDIINTALYWSGITTHFNQDLFFDMIKMYQNTGGMINLHHVQPAFYGTLNWLGWLIYKIECSCATERTEDKILDFEQVNQTLATILRLETVIPKVIQKMNFRR